MPHRQPKVTTDGIAPRGVWKEPYVGRDGEMFLVAVDHRGRRVMEATVYPGTVDPAVVTEFLEAMLEKADPTHIRVVP